MNYTLETDERVLELFVVSSKIREPSSLILLLALIEGQFIFIR
jgi:hypothetical protein